VKNVMSQRYPHSRPGIPSDSSLASSRNPSKLSSFPPEHGQYSPFQRLFRSNGQVPNTFKRWKLPHQLPSMSTGRDYSDTAQLDSAHSRLGSRGCIRSRNSLVLSRKQPQTLGTTIDSEKNYSEYWLLVTSQRNLVSWV
jgi:hypothetical protein